MSCDELLLSRRSILLMMRQTCLIALPTFADQLFAQSGIFDFKIQVADLAPGTIFLLPEIHVGVRIEIRKKRSRPGIFDLLGNAGARFQVGQFSAPYS